MKIDKYFLKRTCDNNILEKSKELISRKIYFNNGNVYKFTLLHYWYGTFYLDEKIYFSEKQPLHLSTVEFEKKAKPEYLLLDKNYLGKKGYFNFKPNYNSKNNGLYMMFSIKCENLQNGKVTYKDIFKISGKSEIKVRSVSEASEYFQTYVNSISNLTFGLEDL
jgi:hypothetical protein